MNQAIAKVAAFILIIYVVMVFGCIQSHQANDVSLENPPSNEEIEDSIMAIKCLVPKPTPLGIGLSIVVTLAGMYLGVKV